MKYADYIKEIEIDALWGGRKHIKWTLDPQVNILSGVNGDGKSTILRNAMTGARHVYEKHSEMRTDAYERQGIHVTTEPEDAEYVRFDWIGTPDVRSEYDINLQALVEKYNENENETLRYENETQPEVATKTKRPTGYENNATKTILFDAIDRLFEASHKSVDREKREFTLTFWGEPLDLKVLSSGEKQMLTILLAVYLERGEHCVLFMDEPEVSLHVDWQKSLIATILLLNPNVQIILSTHSPAMIMDGWMDKVTEVSEITV
ncbi:MAG: AAA family ATPase [Prevotella sp.]|nr:AAA family ATPase [Prevotella sp.]